MDIASLRQSGQLRMLGRARTRAPAAGFPFGLGASGVHELAEATYGDMPALTGFALAAGGRARAGAVFWVRQRRLAMEHGAVSQREICAYGLADRACLSVQPRKLVDALWTLEEAIRSNAAGLVIGEIETADFTATRRLTLASGRHGVPVILLMPYTRQGATAATARWRVSARPSAINPHDGQAPGRARWRARLERCRTHPQYAGQSFDMDYDDETLSLNLATGLATGQAAPGPASGASIRTGKLWQHTG